MPPTQCPNVLKTSGICHFINISFIPIVPFPNASGNKSIFSFNIVVGLPANLWSFCQPSRTESENSDYVLRGKKACVRCAELSIGIESQ